MTRHSPLASGFCLLLALSPAFAAPATTHKNLLANPGFEQSVAPGEWMPAGWDTTDAGLPTVFFGRDSFFVHDGKWAANLANMSSVLPLSHGWSQIVLVGRESWGKDAVLRVWSRSNGVQGRGFVMLQAFRDTITKMSAIWGVDHDASRRRLNIKPLEDPRIDLGWKRTQFSEPRTDWVLREARVRIVPTTNVLVVKLGTYDIGQLLFDDASLTLEPPRPEATPAVGQNLLDDPGFEGDGNGWEYALAPYEGARFVVDSTVAHAGRHSLRAELPRDGIVQFRMGIAQCLPARALRGKRVRLSTWLKTDSLTTTAFLRIYSHSIGGPTMTPATYTFSGTFDWRETQVELDIPRDAQVTWPWIAVNVPGSGSVWIDDVRFEVIGPALGATGGSRSSGAP